MILLKAKAIIFIYILCISFIVVGTNLFVNLRSYVPKTTYKTSRHIQYSFTIQNETNQLVKEAHFWTYAPVKQTPNQQCLRVETSHSYDLVIDELGNQILHFVFQNLAPYASLVLRVNADMLLSENPNRLKAEDLKPYIQAEPFCESNNPEIIRVAKKLRASETVKTVENSLRWLGGNVKYSGYTRNARGALYALKIRKGDYTEFMYLFTALCRANEIPARGIAGYVINQNTFLKPGGYHNWAAFYDDGLWKPADPQRNILLEKPSNYIAMRLFGQSQVNPLGEFYRFRIEGDGLKARMNG